MNDERADATETCGRCGARIGRDHMRGAPQPEPRQDELEAVARALKERFAPDDVGYGRMPITAHAIDLARWHLDAARRPSVFPESSRPAPTNDTQ